MSLSPSRDDVLPSVRHYALGTGDGINVGVAPISGAANGFADCCPESPLSHHQVVEALQANIECDDRLDAPTLELWLAELASRPDRNALVREIWKDHVQRWFDDRLERAGCGRSRAEVLGEVYRDDGGCFSIGGEVQLCDVLRVLAWREKNDAGDTRHEFEDRSAIVVIGDRWDIEGSTPFSWAGLERT